MSVFNLFRSDCIPLYMVNMNVIKLSVHDFTIIHTVAFNQLLLLNKNYIIHVKSVCLAIRDEKSVKIEKYKMMSDSDSDSDNTVLHRGRYRILFTLNRYH